MPQQWHVKTASSSRQRIAALGRLRIFSSAKNQSKLILNYYCTINCQSFSVQNSGLCLPYDLSDLFGRISETLAPWSAAYGAQQSWQSWHCFLRTTLTFQLLGGVDRSGFNRLSGHKLRHLWHWLAFQLIAELSGPAEEMRATLRCCDLCVCFRTVNMVTVVVLAYVRLHISKCPSQCCKTAVYSTILRYIVTQYEYILHGSSDVVCMISLCVGATAPPCWQHHPVTQRQETSETSTYSKSRRVSDVLICLRLQIYVEMLSKQSIQRIFAAFGVATETSTLTCMWCSN